MIRGGCCARRGNEWTTGTGRCTTALAFPQTARALGDWRRETDSGCESLGFTTHYIWLGLYQVVEVCTHGRPVGRRRVGISDVGVVVHRSVWHTMKCTGSRSGSGWQSPARSATERSISTAHRGTSIASPSSWRLVPGLATG